MLRTLAIAAVIMAAACSPIQHTQQVSQPTGATVMAGVGDEVLRISKETSLPNAFGNADAFGRTTPTGFTIVSYQGLQDGKALLLRRNIIVETGATTMNSTPLFIPNTTTTTVTGFAGTTPVYGTATTQGPPTIVLPNTPQAQVINAGDAMIAVPVGDLPREIVVDSVKVRLLGADEWTLRYMILGE